MKKNISLFFITSVLILLAAEGIFRGVGFIPGQIYQNQWFHKVDSLYHINGFMADHNGIYKIDTAVANTIEKDAVQNKNDLITWSHKVHTLPWSMELTAILQNHLQVMQDDTGGVVNSFTEKLKKIREEKRLTPFDSIFMQYAKQPINADGFYSIAFTASCAHKKKILLLGDSFTWGHSTWNKTASFANTLLARDYLVYNTGISGADVAQYQQILNTYLDVIKPDVVVVNFFMGNDVAYFERIPKANIPVHYSTNAGNLLSFREGNQFVNMHQAYDNIIRHTYIPQTTTANKLASQTVITSLVWRILARLQLIKFNVFNPPIYPETPFSNQQLAAMQQLCQTRNVPFILSVIPAQEGRRLKGATTVNNLFKGMEYAQPQVALEHYNVNDGHFNEEGHLFYANYLEKLIIAATAKPVAHTFSSN